MEELIKLAGVCVVCVPLAALLRRAERESRWVIHYGI